MTDLSRDGRELERRVSYGDDGVREAVRTGIGFAAAGLLFLVTASIWVGTCTGATADAMACGAPQRAVLALGAPAIFMMGVVWSLARSLRVRRDQTAWPVWLGTASALVALMVVSVALSLPSLPGR